MKTTYKCQNCAERSIENCLMMHSIFQNNKVESVMYGFYYTDFDCKDHVPRKPRFDYLEEAK